MTRQGAFEVDAVTDSCTHQQPFSPTGTRFTTSFRDGYNQLVNDPPGRTEFVSYRLSDQGNTTVSYSNAGATAFFNLRYTEQWAK